MAIHCGAECLCAHLPLTEVSNSQCNFYYSVEQKNYQHVLALIFAVHEINKNPRILSNITLGLHIYDNVFDSLSTYKAILDLLFPKQVNVLRFDRKEDVLSVIGGLTVINSLQMATILGIYKIPQVCE